MSRKVELMERYSRSAPQANNLSWQPKVSSSKLDSDPRLALLLRSRLQSPRSFATRRADLKAVETKLFKSFDGSNIDLGSRAVTRLAP